MGTAEIDLVDVAVLLLVDARDPRAHRIADCEIAAGAQADAIAATAGRLDIAPVVAARLLRIQPDRAAFRVASGERALRTTQDLDAIEVQQVEF